MRNYVIGDIHGCYEELVKILEKIDLDFSTDRLIFTGDYIDRGDKSYEVLSYLKKLQEKQGDDKVVLLRGNHEQMAIDYFERADSSWFSNGCNNTLYSFKRNGADIMDYLDYFKSMPFYLEDEKFICVHAGIRPRLRMKDQYSEDLLWIRERFYESSCTFDKTIIFGHTPTKYITGDNRQYLVTG